MDTYQIGTLSKVLRAVISNAFVFVTAAVNGSS